MKKFQTPTLIRIVIEAFVIRVMSRDLSLRDTAQNEYMHRGTAQSQSTLSENFGRENTLARGFCFSVTCDDLFASRYIKKNC